MRSLLLAALAVGSLISATTVVTAADAKQGCGRGYHRTPRGRCISNRAGVYYRNHGWWNGQRYYQHRYRANNGWRYR